VGAQRQARHHRERRRPAMHQLTQLAGDAHRQRLAHAEAQRPTERLLALASPARYARRLRAQLHAQTTSHQ
jgi:hypothetical protein